jgi:hypothetical protein
MKKGIIILGGILLIIVFIFLSFLDIPLTINFKQGKYFDYKVGTLNKENNAVLDPILMKHPEIIAKYFLSAASIDTIRQFHCIEPFIEISDNRSTIWSKIFPRYFLNYSLVFLAKQSDTTISHCSIMLKVLNRKLYLRSVINNSDKNFQNIQVCDPIFIRPCMIKK